MLIAVDPAKWSKTGQDAGGGRDGAGPDTGLAIWRVDERGNNDNQHMTAQSHFECALVQADGACDLEYYKNAGDWKDLYDAVEAPEFPGANNTSTWWDCAPAGLAICDISAPGEVMTFKTR